MAAENRQSEVIESFRKSLEDVITIVSKLAPLCTTFDDLVGMVTLAMENDGQVRTIMKIVQAK